MTAVHKADRIRWMVMAGSAFGLCIAVAIGVGIAGGDGARGWQKGLFAVGFCAPFLVALVSTRLDTVARQRGGLAVAAILSALAGAVLIFSGVGVFYLALALGFSWASIAIGRPGAPASIVEPSRR